MTQCTVPVVVEMEHPAWRAHFFNSPTLRRIGSVNTFFLLNESNRIFHLFRIEVTL